ncbi:hypothetical protein, partial [Alistipes ihumii]|uniref:hypothetical protein n=1 Tax=Alistipes ihumii TaxID=1470347 RepID=UPI003AF46CE7
QNEHERTNRRENPSNIEKFKYQNIQTEGVNCPGPLVLQSLPMRGADKSKLAVRTAFPAVAPSGSEFNELSLSCEFVCTMTLLQNEGQGA